MQKEHNTHKHSLYPHFLKMASSKEKIVAEMFEKLALRNSKDACHTLDPKEKKTEVDQKNVHENNQENNKPVNSDSEPSKSANNKFDDKSFVSSNSEEGESSKQDEGTLL